MTLNDIAQGEPWMDHEERKTAADLAHFLQQSFADRQIPETPFLLLRVQDFLLHHTLCRRLERASLSPDPDTGTPAVVTPALAAHIGKARDRLRKSLKELEDSANKLATSPATRPSTNASPAAWMKEEPPKAASDSAPAALGQGEIPAKERPIPPTSPTGSIAPPPSNKPNLPAARPPQPPKPIIYTPKPFPFDRSHRNK